MNNPLVSVIIPTYNEQGTIKDCLQSLTKQGYKPLEIILVDDGSTDRTIEIIKNRQQSITNIQLFRQNHQGPGTARNLGASKARGQILVFVDADMTFDKDFIKDLISPILAGKTIGTFSKNEFVSNKENVWSICWNINRQLPAHRMLPENYPDEAPVFRAILKKEFDKVAGFERSGQYTDDWSLSRKLGIRSKLAKGAIYYHANPATLAEVWKQARWIGKNEFMSGNLWRKIRSLVIHNPASSLIMGTIKSVINFNFYFLLFKLVYDLAIIISVNKSFLGEKKAK